MYTARKKSHWHKHNEWNIKKWQRYLYTVFIEMCRQRKRKTSVAKTSVHVGRLNDNNNLIDCGLDRRKRNAWRWRKPVVRRRWGSIPISRQNGITYMDANIILFPLIIFHRRNRHRSRTRWPVSIAKHCCQLRGISVLHHYQTNLS